MTSPDALDRKIAEFVRDGVALGHRDGFAGAMARTTTVTQRPAWLAAMAGSTRGLSGEPDRRPIVAVGLLLAVLMLTLSALVVVIGSGARFGVSDLAAPAQSLAVEPGSPAPSPGPSSAPTTALPIADTVREFPTLGFEQVWFGDPYTPELRADASAVAFRSPVFTTGPFLGSYAAFISVGRPGAGAVVQWGEADGQVCETTAEQSIRSLIRILATVGEPTFDRDGGAPVVALAPTVDNTGAAGILVEDGRCAAFVVISPRHLPVCGEACTIDAIDAVRFMEAGFRFTPRVTG